MSENCNGNCSSCSANCESRQQESMLAPLNEYSRVGKVIGVVSGKGGVGKSAVTAMLATLMARKGYKCAVLDADLTGPSIPKVFGVHGIVTSEDGEHLLPAKTAGGIDIMSINLLLESEDAPVIWRGPVISGVIKQFWSDVVWGDIDYLLVDMPPGTGDVPLTVFQSLPVDGIIVVTSPQELVGMIVAKAVNMAEAMKVPVLGLVENMAYFVCPNCNEKHYLFGESQVDVLAQEYEIGATAQIPTNPTIATLCDAGKVDQVDSSWLDDIVAAIV